jgi:hypothetical protein
MAPYISEAGPWSFIGKYHGAVGDDAMQQNHGAVGADAVQNGYFVKKNSNPVRFVLKFHEKDQFSTANSIAWIRYLVEPYKYDFFRGCYK